MRSPRTVPHLSPEEMERPYVIHVTLADRNFHGFDFVHIDVFRQREPGVLEVIDYAQADPSDWRSMVKMVVQRNSLPQGTGGVLIIKGAYLPS